MESCNKAKETMFHLGIGYKSTNPQKISSKKKKILEYVIDETIIKVGSEYIWFRVAIIAESKESWN